MIKERRNLRTIACIFFFFIFFLLVLLQFFFSFFSFLCRCCRCGGKNTIALLVSSKVAAMGPTSCQLVPQTNHLPWRLIVCSVVVLHAPILTELPVVRVLNRGGAIELLNPHAHAYILHLKQLHPKNKNKNEVLRDLKLRELFQATKVLSFDQ